MHSLFPPPWNLTGVGYMLLYRFKRDFVNQEGLIPPFLKGKFTGGFGAVMIVDYHSSNCGPYSELLFIPGKFGWKGKRLNTITKIYVSSQLSVDAGRQNWAIPKEKADFNFEGDVIDIKTPDGNRILKTSLRPWGPPLPVDTRLLPFPLIQKRDEELVYTDFSGKGMGKLCKVESMEVNPEFFPNISLTKPMTVLKVDPFNISFPVPIVESFVKKV